MGKGTPGRRPKAVRREDVPPDHDHRVAHDAEASTRLVRYTAGRVFLALLNTAAVIAWWPPSPVIAFAATASYVLLAATIVSAISTNNQRKPKR